MKKLLLLLVLVITLTTNVNGQSRLNYSLTELKNAFPTNVFTYHYDNVGKLDNVTTKFDYGIFIYYFNELKVTYAGVYIMYNIKCLNIVAKSYNENYLSVSTNCWKVYTEGGATLIIELKYMETKDDNSGGYYYFLYTLG